MFNAMGFRLFPGPARYRIQRESCRIQTSSYRGAGALRRAKVMPDTKTRPAIDGAYAADNAAQVGRFREASPEKPYRGILRGDFSSRHMMFVGAAVSIFIHSGLIAAIALMHVTRPVPLPNSRYIYVTLASGEPRNRKTDGKYSARFDQEGEKSKNSRNVAHLPGAVRRARKPPPRRRRQKHPVANSPTLVRSIPAPSVVAKADDPSKGPILLKDEGRTSSLQEGETRGEGLAGVPGIVAYQAPILLSRVIPSYPENARRLGIEGQVVLRFVVDQSGRVEREIEVVTSLPMLDQAAIEAVRQWRFSPARDRDGNPVRVLVSVPVQFTLR